MKIIEYFDCDNQEYWLKQIQKSDWGAGQYLYERLAERKVKQLFGESTKVLLLTDTDKLVSFCTLAEQDEIQEPSMTPWIGFVYTFPEYRGRRLAGELLDYAYQVAKERGDTQIYISTGEIGLYEKYGYQFLKMMTEPDGEKPRVYRREM